MRYILALLPPEPQKMVYIRVAQTFSPICDGYLLADDTSSPHITLCSFDCDEGQLIEICDHVKKWQINLCSIRIMGLLLKKGKVPPHHYSVSLSIARDPPILQFHRLTTSLLRDLDIDALNPIEDLYAPHLTLAGVRWGSTEIVSLPPSIDELISTPVDPFHLVLGKGDDIGQYLGTLCKF